MKTLTEFSGIILRQAKAARDEVTAAGAEADALAEKLAESLSIASERASRLLEALEVAGDKLDAVRLVRVFQGETAPPRSRTVGEFHYVVDLVAAPARLGRDARGRGGRDGRRGGPGGRGPGGPGGRGPGGPGGRGPGGPGGRGPGGPRGDRPPRDGERGPRGEVPQAGAGWTLTRAPRDAGDGGDRRGQGESTQAPPR